MKRLQIEPYRALFPLAVLLSWAGVLHWFLLGVGLYGGYERAFHAMTQIQGAMTCFALGFLLTFIPRRTGTGPVSLAMVGLSCAAPVAAVVAAGFHQWVVAQLFWGGLVVALLVFIRQRGRGAPTLKKLHASFVWVPASLIATLVASLTAGWGAAKGQDWMWLHQVSSHLILQGLFTGLILGVGGLMLPVLTRGGDATSEAPDVRRRHQVIQAVCALLFFLSFLLEPASLRGAFLVRTVVVTFVLVFMMKLWRLPTQHGISPWLLWISAWMVPLGYAVCFAFPDYRLAGLHILFIGGFWMMALTLSSHVVRMHGGLRPLTRRGSWPLASAALLLMVALAARALMVLDPYHVMRWMAVASGAFLMSSMGWAILVLPGILSSPAEGPR